MAVQEKEITQFVDAMLPQVCDEIEWHLVMLLYHCSYAMHRGSLTAAACLPSGLSHLVAYGGRVFPDR